MARARARLAGLEVDYAKEKSRVDAMQAVLFRQLREHYQKRDRLRLTEQAASWPTNHENDLAAKRRRRRKNKGVFAPLVPFRGNTSVFYPTVSSESLIIGGSF